MAERWDEPTPNLASEIANTLRFSCGLLSRYVPANNSRGFVAERRLAIGTSRSKTCPDCGMPLDANSMLGCPHCFQKRTAESRKQQAQTQQTHTAPNVSAHRCACGQEVAAWVSKCPWCGRSISKTQMAQPQRTVRPKPSPDSAPKQWATRSSWDDPAPRETRKRSARRQDEETEPRPLTAFLLWISKLDDASVKERKESGCCLGSCVGAITYLSCGPLLILLALFGPAVVGGMITYAKGGEDAILMGIVIGLPVGILLIWWGFGERKKR